VNKMITKVDDIQVRRIIIEERIFELQCEALALPNALETRAIIIDGIINQLEHRLLSLK